jgi:hypothetical protein
MTPNMKRVLVALAAIAVSSTASFAQNGITLGNPTYGGNGCPSGSVSAALSPDATSLSILFDQYQAMAGGSTGRSFDRKSCNVAIPVNVPNGFSVSLIAVDYRGFNMLPQGATSTFGVEYFFAGSRGPVFNRTFRGALTDDYTIRNELLAVGNVWSACGVDVLLRTNTNVRVTTTQNREAMATVDTQDVAAALIYRLAYRPC